KPPKRISLPTYPFERKRYWLHEKENIQNNFVTSHISQLHPLVQQNISNLEAQQFSTVLTGNEFFLIDHVIANQKTLPGVTYIEMALSACRQSTKIAFSEIADIVWIQPIIFSNTPQQIVIQLYPSKDHIDFQIKLKLSENHDQLSTQGKLIAKNNIRRPTIDIRKIQSRCSHTIETKEIYDKFLQDGYQYGKTFQPINKLYMGENEALSDLILPDEVKSDFDKYLLHPSLMDGALQTTSGILSLESSDDIFMPFSIGKVIYYQSLPVSCFAYATLKIHSELKIFDISIVDHSGNVCVTIIDFTLRPIPKKEQPEMIYFQPEWQQKDINLIENPIDDKVLIFTHTGLDEFNKRCPNHITVTTGEFFKQISETHYCINPSKEKDYQELFDQIGQPPKYIIHLLSNQSFEQNDASIKNCISQSLFSLIYVCKALLNNQLSNIVRLIYGCPSNQPLYEAISGFAKTLALESAFIELKTVCMNRMSAMSHEIISECLINDGFEINYTDTIRQVKQLKPFKRLTHKSFTLKENGVYLITGGSGILGQIFAKYIDSKVQSTIVLCGRKEALDHDTLTQLEGFASDSVYIQADMSIQKDVKHLVKAIKETYGKLTGIIHCAGVIQDAYIINKDIQDTLNVIYPKVLGSAYLDDATQNDDLDFFVLFSSLSAAIGNAGQSDYAYANSFMDAFARYRNHLKDNNKRFGVTVSINWPLWQEGGMTIDGDSQKLYANISGLLPIKNEHGIDAFETALSENKDQIIVSYGHAAKINQMIEKLNHPEVKKDQQFSPKLDTEEIIQEIHKALITLASNILKVDSSDMQIDDDLYDYGFDSITFTQFANIINDKYQFEITPTLFFEYSSIKQIASALYLINNEYFNKLYQKNKTKHLQKSDVPVHKFTDIQKAHHRFVKQKKIMPQLSPKNQDIAIIGMSGVMPGAKNLTEFWEYLSEGIDLISEVPNDRWDFRTYADKKNLHLRWGGFMPDIDKFDPEFFNLSPKEAELMDPQQRLFLQTVWHTIEDAGYKASDFSGSKTGVFVGVGTSDYSELLRMQGENNAWVSTGNAHSILANRVSYLLNLHGPSEPIDTACSSSLIAIHRAVESIQSDKCNLAIVGGVNAILTPTLNISFSHAGMLSPDGRCKTFDQSANGYVRGEGVGAIILKPLHEAEKDHDHIYAIIKGSAENHGGNAQSITAPNPNAQKELLISAYEDAHIDSSTVTYIEAHGTGTSLGDSIEIEALKKAFSSMYEKHDKIIPQKPVCGIGAVKTNIGHLETAAGIAGVLKILLSLKYKQIPPNINFNTINPYIQLENSPFYLITQKQEWKSLTDNSGNPIPRRAGISSFGFGGSNAHVVIEEYVNNNPIHENNEEQIIVLSAKNKDRLDDYAKVLLEYCSQNQQKISIVNMAYTLQIGRETMEERVAIVVSNIDDLTCKLSSFTEKSKDQTGIYTGNPKQNKDKKSILIGGKAGQLFIHNIIETKDFDRIAQLWVLGIEIDWQLLYDTPPIRIPLPTYPFEKKRCWIHKKQDFENINVFSQGNQLHPLVHQNISSMEVQQFSTVLTGNEFFLMDHV
ncbi:MAG: SDR family NAD(P)-dependent oxidoreductase, partial [Candidatus Magnetomorum sp.]|nr:SDR family NAD(P)-dependent oxidoreductase [Candidatus Magnetomorum sp.]